MCAQQLQSFDENKKKIYIYANYTKDAKKESHKSSKFKAFS